MNVEVLWDRPLSRNLTGDEEPKTCAYPTASMGPNGDILCSYRRGREKHSYDGVLVVRTSSDQGETWSDPVSAFDGLALDPPKSVVAGGVCWTAGDAWLASMGTVEVTKPDTYVFSDEGRQQRRHCIALRSEDRGATWSEPVEIERGPFPRAGVASKAVMMADGRVFQPIEATAADGLVGTAGTLSEDDGRSFGPLATCALDPDGEKCLCDARLTVLRDGSVLMMLWTFLQDGEATVDVHRCFSTDNGQTWSAAEPVGMLGQIATPLEIHPGVVIAAANFREPPEGIRLWLSRDGGRTWDTDHPIQMWDVRASRMLAQPIAPEPEQETGREVWDELPNFTFGTPDLLPMPDGSALLIYYAIVDDVTHIRACKFRVTDL